MKEKGNSEVRRECPARVEERGEGAEEEEEEKGNEREWTNRVEPMSYRRFNHLSDQRPSSVRTGEDARLRHNELCRPSALREEDKLASVSSLDQTSKLTEKGAEEGGGRTV